MTDNCRTTVLAGVAGGYLLGRTKKAKLALTFAALVAGRRLAPQDLLEKGARRLAGTPQLAGLSDQVKDQMMTAARTAVGSLVDRRVESITGSLRERTDRLGALREEREARDDRDDRDEEGEGEGEGEGRGRRAAASKRRPPARKKPAGNGGSGTSRPRKKAASGGGGGSRGAAKSKAEGPGKSTGKKSAEPSRRSSRS
jgi:hypothetical protein